MVRRFLTFSLLLATSSAWAEVKISPQDVADRIMNQGYRVQEINLQSQLGYLDTVKAESLYDWLLQINSGQTTDQTRTLTNPYNTYKNQTYQTDFLLQKSFFTGTTAKVSYSRYSLNSQANPNLSTPLPGILVADNIGLELDQSLLRDSFGYSGRKKVSAAEKSYRSTMINRANELQTEVLNGMRLYWATYVSQLDFKEALASRDRYAQIVNTVQRKSKMGFADPGELAQAQAEFETRVQTVKTKSNDYLKNLDSLLTTLRLPKDGQDVNFIVPTELPPIPQLKRKDPETLREVRSAKLKIESLDDAVQAAKSDSYVDISLVGQVNSTGVAEKAQDSYSDMISSKYPKYYVGLRLQTTFGSGEQAEEVRNKTISKNLNETILKRRLDEIQDEESEVERKVKAFYAIAKSAEVEKGFRDKAAQEITRSYNQGRTNINTLIDVLNRYFTSQNAYAKALGDYHTALNEWAASRDELIPDENTKE